MSRLVFVTDFDGTITANDFYKLVAARLLPPDALIPWQEYRAGVITHFEALRRIFACIRTTESEMLNIVRDMAPDPLLDESVAALRAAGWKIVVASAGCAWYIERVLTWAGLNIGPDGDVEVHANPGQFSPQHGLTMHLPTDASFLSPETGVDKAAIVRFYLNQGATVAFAGDGFADLPAAMLVAPELRFARADLETALQEQGLAGRPFSRWADVVEALLGRQST